VEGKANQKPLTLLPFRLPKYFSLAYTTMLKIGKNVGKLKLCSPSVKTSI